MRVRFPEKTAIVVLVAACGGGGTTNPDPGFNPTSNTSISGNATYESVNIPAGVTVTVTANAVITVTGDYTQAGTLTAPCHALTLVVDGAVAVTGNIGNQCATATATPPDLRIVGKTSYSFIGGTISTSGDLSIVNDPAESLTSPGTSPARVLPPDSSRALVTIGRCHFDNENINIDNAPNGTAANPNGPDGPSAFLGCGFLFSGNTGGTVTMNNVTINGASGGDGRADEKTDAPATGGNGGPPGSVNVSADEGIELSGAVTVNAGDGGDGGDATSTGSTGDPGKDATATGGNGAGLDPEGGESPVRFVAGTSITQIGSLTINIGDAGFGGDATATGGNGIAKGPVGAAGGRSTGTGGNGGPGMTVFMNAQGAVSLGGVVQINGGPAGDGGLARCLGGNGGDGVGAGSSGGPAGAKTCRGGNGGNGAAANLRQGTVAALRLGEHPANLAPGTPGGDAGAAEFQSGKGGIGQPNCPTGPGGGGGKGSDIIGGDGSRGSGTPNGSGANATVTDAANGGNGASPGGAGGDQGANGLAHGLGATGGFNITNSFNPGLPGGVCPAQITFASILPNNPSIVQGGSGTINVNVNRFNVTTNLTARLKDAGGTTRGQATIPGPAGTSASFGYTVPIGEQTGTRNWVVDVFDTNVPPIMQNYPINVTPFVAPGWSMSLTPPSGGTLNRGATGQVRASAVRMGGFTGGIGLTLQDADGRSIGTGSIPPGDSFFDIFFEVPFDEHLGSRNWNVRSTATGFADINTQFPVMINQLPQPTNVLFALPASFTGGVISPGTYVAPILDAVSMVQVGTYQLVGVGSPLFFQPNRIGWGGSATWIRRFATAKVNGGFFDVKEFEDCFNPNANITAGNSIFIKHKRDDGFIHKTENVTSTTPDCLNQMFTIQVFESELGGGTASGNTPDTKQNVHRKVRKRSTPINSKYRQPSPSPAPSGAPFRP